jgi:hypothetical protein
MLREILGNKNRVLKIDKNIQRYVIGLIKNIN